MSSPKVRALPGSRRDPAPTRERRMQSEVRARVRTSAGSDARFESALRDVRDDPGNDEAWQQLEAECEHTNAPDQVASAYLRMLTPSLAPELRRELAQRAYAFH